MHNDDIEAFIERVDALAAHMLNRRGENRPATVVYDEARDIIEARDTAERRRVWEADRGMFAAMEDEGLI